MESEIQFILRQVKFSPGCEMFAEQRDQLLEMDGSGLLSALLFIEEQLQQPATHQVQYCAYEYLFAGAITLDQGRPHLACMRLDQAVCAFRRQNDSYNEGLALWLLMLAYSRDRQVAAASACYQEAMRKFRNWASSELPNGENHPDYLMLKEALRKSYESARTAQPATASSARPAESAVGLDFLSIRLFPEILAVQAGPDGSLWVENSQEEIRLDVNSFRLGEEAYAIFSVRPDDRCISIQRDRQYGWARVQGNSMNAATPVPIVEGDLALFYQSEGTANENAIVIASRPDDHDPKAYQYMIKRWRAGQFLSESTEDYPPIPVDDRHRILGVVVAIAKRKSA